MIRSLWDVGQPGGASFEGSYYGLRDAARGPAPLHDVSIWVGAYKPRMLNLTGRKADGWLPSLPLLAAGNRAIDEAAVEAGRDPSEIRRLLNVPSASVEELIRFALEDGIGTFILMADDGRTIHAFASALNEMALRQNDWTFGAFCSRYCGVVTQHHGLEDEAIFPHLVRSDRTLEPVIQRLAEEHFVIHDAIQVVDRALVDHMTHPEDYEPIQTAIDFLSDTLLSHLSYEEHEIVEPLARFGFYPGQL